MKKASNLLPTRSFMSLVPAMRHRVPLRFFCPGRVGSRPGSHMPTRWVAMVPFPAIRTACGLLAASYAALPTPKNRVDIVHTEYLSLHVDFLAHEPGNYVMNALFGDGFIKYSAYPLGNFLASNKRGLKLLAVQERLVPNSLDEI